MSRAEPQMFEHYSDARREHAWLLRAEGLKYREIAQHLGVSTTRAVQMVEQFSRRVQAGIRRQRAKRVIAFNTRQWAIVVQREKLKAEADRWIEAWVSQ